MIIHTKASTKVEFEELKDLQSKDEDIYLTKAYYDLIIRKRISIIRDINTALELKLKEQLF